MGGKRIFANPANKVRFWDLPAIAYGCGERPIPANSGLSINQQSDRSSGHSSHSEHCCFFVSKRQFRELRSRTCFQTGWSGRNPASASRAHLAIERSFAGRSRRYVDDAMTYPPTAITTTAKPRSSMPLRVPSALLSVMPAIVPPTPPATSSPVTPQSTSPDVA